MYASASAAPVRACAFSGVARRGFASAVERANSRTTLPPPHALQLGASEHASIRLASTAFAAADSGVDSCCAGGGAAAAQTTSAGAEAQQRRRRASGASQAVVARRRRSGRACLCSLTATQAAKDGTRSPPLAARSRAATPHCALLRDVLLRPRRGRMKNGALHFTFHTFNKRGIAVCVCVCSFASRVTLCLNVKWRDDGGNKHVHADCSATSPFLQRPDCLTRIRIRAA